MKRILLPAIAAGSLVVFMANHHMHSGPQVALASPLKVRLSPSLIKVCQTYDEWKAKAKQDVPDMDQTCAGKIDAE